MTAESQIISKFPYPSFRQDQQEAIDVILKQFESDKKFVILEAPTGSGKSAIAYTVAQFFKRSFWLSPQKVLQDQAMRDFGSPPKSNLHPTVDLKGRSNYVCTHNQRYAASLIRGFLTTVGYTTTEAKAIAEHFIIHRSFEGLSCKLDFSAVSKIMEICDKKVTCGEGICRTRDGKSKCKECFPDGKPIECPYWTRHIEAQLAPICLMNFRVFLHQTALTNAFDARDLMILDEAHSIESELMDFISFNLSDRPLRDFDIIIPELPTAADYAKFLQDKKVPDIISKIVKEAREEGNVKKEDEWLDAARRCDHFIETAGNGNWVSLYKKTNVNSIEWNTVELRPVYIREMAEDYVFEKAEKILMMSATILSASAICSSLGIDKSQAFAIRYPCRFPAKNRPIFFQPIGSLSYKNKAETLPKMAPAVDKILNKYEGKRGIIHTFNFEIARLLLKECKTRKRMLIQDDFETKNEMLKHHAQKEGSVIVAPNMREGIDLMEDLSRFAIIAKMPYPPIKGNPQLEARVRDSQDYYDWLVGTALMQAIGRSVRSETDWADTYIIDSDFGWFLKKAGKKMFPAWFVEAIKCP